MTDAKEVFEVLGVVLQWKLESAETDGQYCVLEAMVPPGAMVPPHQHVEQEAFFVLEGEGEFGALVGGQLAWSKVTAGEMCNIPSDSVHGFRNVTEKPMRCLITAHPRIEGFFKEAGTPVSPTPAPPTMAQIERVLGIAMRHGQRFLPPA